MSVKAMSWAIDVVGLKAGQKLVLMLLADAHNGQTGECFPHQGRIAEQAGMGVSTVQAHLLSLEKLGMLSRNTQKLGRGKGSRTQYTLDLSILDAQNSEVYSDLDPSISDNRPLKNTLLDPQISGVSYKDEPEKNRKRTGRDACDHADPPKKPKRKPTVRGSARKTQIPDSWQPSPENYALAKSRGLNPAEINHEADSFRSHAQANARKLVNWHAGFNQWCIKAAKWKLERQAADYARRDAAGNTSFSGIAAEMAGHASRPADESWTAGHTIEGEFSVVETDGATTPRSGDAGQSDRANAGPLHPARQANSKVG